MKTLFSSILLFTSTLLLAQNPILPLDTPYNQITHNAYLKDTQNQLLPFEGAWVYNQGNTIVTIKFKKIMDYYDLDYPNYYSDIIVANYQVEKNGMTIFSDSNKPIDKSSSIYGYNFHNEKFSITYIDETKCAIGGSGYIWINANGKLQWAMHISDYNPWSLDECPEALEPNLRNLSSSSNNLFN